MYPTGSDSPAEVTTFTSIVPAPSGTTTTIVFVLLVMKIFKVRLGEIAR